MADDETVLQLYANPVLIQTKCLDQLQSKLLADTESVVEGNNPFTFLLEMGATMTSGAVLEACEKFRSLYPCRANKASDLYKHMSDYDYVDLFSTPASSAINLFFERDYLINNAVVFNENYRKIVIPEYSTFKIGEFVFGIHYPIEIQIRTVPDPTTGKINNEDCTFNIIWDTTNRNPLQTLASNTLNFYQFRQEDLNMVAIAIPVQQFEVVSHIEDAVPDLGFVRKLSFTDKFYAARVFHYRNETWNELHTTMSDSVYDQTLPTAQLKVLTDTNEVEVIIPQVYFTNRQIGNRVLIKLYTTRGAIDFDISRYTPDQFIASFLINDELIDDTYSAMLKLIPVLQMGGATNRITGGSNGLDFDTWRNRVIYDVNPTLLVTPADVSAHFNDAGFSVSTFKDNITDRIYIAQKVMTDKNGIIVAAADIQTKFSEAMFNNLDKTYSTIKRIDSSSFMVLPSTMYLYDESISAAVPLSDEDMLVLKNMSKEDRVAELNSKQYSFSPYHLKLNIEDELPLAGSYDLMHPLFTKIVFDYQNPNVSSQVSIYGLGITHTGNGETGYKIHMTLYKTVDLMNVDPVSEEDIKNIQVVMRATNSAGKAMYQIGRYVGKSESGRDVVEFDIATNYKLSVNDTLDTDSFIEDGTGLKANEIALDSDVDFLFFVNPDILAATTPMLGVPVGDIPQELNSEVYVLKQNAHLNLGKSIPLLMNNVALGVTSRNFATWPTTEYATYTSNIYKRWTRVDADNGDCSETQVGTLKFPLELLHAQGEVMVVDVPGSPTIPPSCIYKELGVNNAGETVANEVHTLYLKAPYTSLSSRSNKWIPADENVDAINIEVVSILNYSCTFCKTYDSNSTPVRLDLVVRPDGTFYDENVGYLFAYIESAASDMTDPENDLGCGLGGAMYRRDTRLANFDPCSVLDGVNLYGFYSDVDFGLTTDQLAKVYSISIANVSKLIAYRRPWIKMVPSASLARLKEYAVDHDINTVSLSTKEVETYAELSDYTNTSISDKEWVHVLKEDKWYQATVVDTQISWKEFEEAGLMYLISRQLDESTSEHVAVKFLTYIEHSPTGDYKLDLSKETSLWSAIDQWPWETVYIQRTNVDYPKIEFPWINLSEAKIVNTFSLELNHATSAKIKTIGGSYMVDENGEPVYDEATGDQLRAAIYYVNMLQIDYKLTQSDDMAYVNYPTTVRDQLEGYFTTLQTAKPLLLEQTELYFAPIKTLGMAPFKGINGTLQNLSLAISISLRLYVEQYVMDSESTKNLIKENVLKLVDAHIASGTISCVKLAEEIRSTMDDTVQFVDILGINGNPDLQTLIAVDETSAAHLKQDLIIKDDGSLSIDRQVNITFNVI